MAGKWNDKRCSTCGVGTLHDDVRERSNEYRGRTFRAEISGAFCDNCDDGMLYHDPQNDDDWEDFCAQVDADERRELAAIRRRLKLTQEQASKITGGGHNAFSRYERGEAVPLMAVVNLFRLLDRFPSLLRELTDRENVHSHPLVYSLSAPVTEGWCTVPTKRAGAGSIRVAVPIDSSDAANEWHVGTGATGAALEAA
jgi:HTH-type transcriptional regulator/antitoxin MqsA